MFCAFLGHTGERLQDHWSSGYYMLGGKSEVTFVRRCFRDARKSLPLLLIQKQQVVSCKRMCTKY